MHEKSICCWMQQLRRRKKPEKVWQCWMIFYAFSFGSEWKKNRAADETESCEEACERKRQTSSRYDSPLFTFPSLRRFVRQAQKKRQFVVRLRRIGVCLRCRLNLEIKKKHFIKSRNKIERKISKYHQNHLDKITQKLVQSSWISQRNKIRWKFA